MEQGTCGLDDPSSRAPLKLCECGCGGTAPVAKANNMRRGAVKGQPQRFIKGHAIRNGNAPWFKGDDVGYRAIHTYLCKHFPKTEICDECGEPAERTEYALIHGREYSREREDYRELCKPCHNAYDETGGSRWRGIATARQIAGHAPLCACGCGDQVGWDGRHARWRRFMPGHYAPQAHLNGKIRRVAAASG